MMKKKSFDIYSKYENNENIYLKFHIINKSHKFVGNNT